MAKGSVRRNRSNAERFSEDECRVCLKNSGEFPIYGDTNRPNISAEIMMIADISISVNDEFPKFICGECFQLLDGAITFRHNAQHSNTLLKRRLKRSLSSLANNSKQNETLKIKNEAHDTEKPDIDFVSVKLDGDIPIERCDSNNESTTDNTAVDDQIDEDNRTESNSETVLFDVSDDKKDIVINNCTTCDELFQNGDEFEKHILTVEHKKNYIMNLWPMKPKNKSRTDEKKTVNPKDHKCDICDRHFTKLHYPRHMQTQHNVKMETSRSAGKKECTVCKRMFHPVALTRHMKKAHGDEKDQPKVKVDCPVCKKQFSKDFFPLHMQRHKLGDTKNYICDQCGKKFFFKSTFYTHRLIHTNDLPHKCEYCPYRGRTKGLLKTHVRTHTGDYPYKCTQCSTRCLTKSNLNAHMQRHKGPVDFICDMCGRGFYSKLDLERHISVSHLGIKEHVCQLCGMAFGYRHGLMSHQLNVHKRPKGVGKAKAVYLKLQEQGLLQQGPKSKAK